MLGAAFRIVALGLRALTTRTGLATTAFTASAAAVDQAAFNGQGTELALEKAGEGVEIAADAAGDAISAGAEMGLNFLLKQVGIDPEKAAPVLEFLSDHQAYALAATAGLVGGMMAGTGALSTSVLALVATGVAKNWDDIAAMVGLEGDNLQQHASAVAPQDPGM